MSRSAILAANAAFYEAFAEHDFAAMDKLWARSTPVACIHPGWDALSGRAAVMSSWQAVLDNPAAPAIRCREPRVTMAGDMAFVVCHEELREGRLIATNVFMIEDNDWKLVHHHAGPVARTVTHRDDDALDRGPALPN